MKGSKVKSIVILTLFNALIAVVAVTVAFITFVGSAVQGQAEAGDMLSLYDDTQYDYIVNNPSDEQISQFSASDITVAVVPFYSVIANFDIDGKQIELEMLSVDDVSDIEYTQFSSLRVIESGEVQGNAVYIDYMLAKNYDLSIGSTIVAGQTEYAVAAIYKATDMYVVFVPDLTDKYSTSIDYTGVYVAASDADAFYTEFLADYEPLGTLLGRESFSDDEAYQNYLNNFHSRDYSSYITTKMSGYDAAVEEYENLVAEVNSQYVTGALISGAVILVCVLFSAILPLKKVKREVADGGKAVVFGRYIFASVITAIVAAAAWCVGCVISSSSSMHYIAIGSVISASWLGILIPVLCALIGCVIDLVLVRGQGGGANKVKGGRR